MYVQIMKSKENKSRGTAYSAALKKGDAQHSYAFVDNRAIAVAQRKLQNIVGSSLVAQLATRLSSPVQFQGGAEALRNLIYRWNYLPGVRVLVQPTDYVGGTYRVRFTRNEGAISKAQADVWVQNALLAHAQQNEQSSDEEN